MMRSSDTCCADRSPYNRYAYALWVAIRILVLLAALCWLALNAAIFFGYLSSADPFSVFSLEPRSHSSNSNQITKGDSRHRSVATNGNICSHKSGETPCRNNTRNVQQDLLSSGANEGQYAAEIQNSAATYPAEYVAVGKKKPNQNGDYDGARPDRMHGFLGLYSDGSAAYIPDPPPPPDIPVQELLSRGGGINVMLSDHLPLDRAPLDSRKTSCKRQQYEISKLPKASVVIIFFNEPFSTLFRSVHSILNLTPPQLLEEIILVDDGGTLDYIKGFRRFEAAQAARAKGSSESVGEDLQNVTADDAFYDNDDDVIANRSDEDEEVRRRLAMRGQSSQSRPPTRRGSPNYRATPALEEYLELLPEKVKLLRNKERKGIVGARMHGIRAAKAPIFIILDSHIEVQPQWIEPLLVRIAADRRRIVMPQIDGTEADTLEYVSGGIGCKLGFLWKLMEHSYESHQLARAAATVKAFRPSSPAALDATTADAGSEGDGEIGGQQREQIETVSQSAETSPVMAGGLFAADKGFFFQIGAYDEAFQYWGTENLELSFRLWQCGGVLECAPCSRVYHIFRKGGAGYSLPPEALTINKMRTMLWMDQYADLAWRVLGKPRVDFGRESLQQRKKWREENKCKSFEWFMHNVFPEGDVLDLRDVPYLGPLRNKGARACLSVVGFPSPGSRVVLRPCQGSDNQDFMYFRTVGHVMPVRDDEACLDMTGGLSWCRAQPELEWKLTAHGQLLHPHTQRCLSGYGVAPHAVACDDTDYFQPTAELSREYHNALRSLVKFTLTSRFLESGKWIHVGENMEKLIDARILGGSQSRVPADLSCASAPAPSAVRPPPTELQLPLLSFAEDCSPGPAPDLVATAHQPPRCGPSFFPPCPSATDPVASLLARRGVAALRCQHVNVPGFSFEISEISVLGPRRNTASSRSCRFRICLRPFLARVLPYLSSSDDAGVGSTNSPVYCLPRLSQHATFKGLSDSSAISSKFDSLQNLKDYWSSRRLEPLELTARGVINDCAAGLELIEQMQLSLCEAYTGLQTFFDNESRRNCNQQFQSAKVLWRDLTPASMGPTANRSDRKMAKAKGCNSDMPLQTPCSQGANNDVKAEKRAQCVAQRTSTTELKDPDELAESTIASCTSVQPGAEKEADAFLLLNLRLPFPRRNKLVLPANSDWRPLPSSARTASDDNHEEERDGTGTCDDNTHRNSSVEGHADERNEVKVCRRTRVLPPVSCYSGELRRTRTHDVPNSSVIPNKRDTPATGTS